MTIFVAQFYNLGLSYSYTSRKFFSLCLHNWYLLNISLTILITIFNLSLTILILKFLYFCLATSFHLWPKICLSLHFTFFHWWRCHQKVFGFLFLLFNIFDFNISMFNFIFHSFNLNWFITFLRFWVFPSLELIPIPNMSWFNSLITSCLVESLKS